MIQLNVEIFENFINIILEMDPDLLAFLVAENDEVIDIFAITIVYLLNKLRRTEYYSLN